MAADKSTDVRVVGSELYLLPVTTRVPLKFGSETLTSVTCARVRLRVEGRDGRVATGWGETPLSVQWVWPANLAYADRHDALVHLCRQLTQAWTTTELWGHALEIGHAFTESVLPNVVRNFAPRHASVGDIPHLAALVSSSPFDIALHDAYGRLHGLPSYDTYDQRYLNHDLSHYLAPADDGGVDFTGRYPHQYLEPPPTSLAAWHLVGGLDALEAADLTGAEPDDGHPVLLADWIERDGLTCLKVKLKGNDPAWDYDRLVRVGRVAEAGQAVWLSADFNCTVTDPAYVNEIVDKLAAHEPAIHAMIRYIEQPFPYDLEKHRIDVHSVAERKPLFMDESAHDWRLIRLGRSLGWSGVALKTCKTQTGALLSLCWAKAHGMELMVQDLTNPMLAQIPHVLLAAHAGTIMGVETNAMQFYPAASDIEARVHPGLYRRRHGSVDLTTIRGAGFGYRVDEIDRALPDPVATSSR